MLDFHKHFGLDRDLKSFSAHVLSMTAASSNLQAAFSSFERSKQSLNEDNFVASLERIAMRDFKTEEERRTTQRALVRKQQLLRLHYLGAWTQMALAVRELDEICRLSLEEEQRIIERNVIHEDEEIQTRFYFERFQMKSLPLTALHAKWLALQDQATMARCIKATSYLYDLCVDGCDDPVEGAALPKQPFNFTTFRSSKFGMMDWHVGGSSFSYYCAVFCVSAQPRPEAGLDDMLGLLRTASTRLANKRSERSRALACVNPLQEKERYEAVYQISKKAEAQAEVDFIRCFDETAGVARDSAAYMQSLTGFISIVRERQKYLSEIREKHGQSIEWLTSMYSLVVAVLNLHQRKQSAAAWAEVRDSKYAPLRQELVQRIVVDQAGETDARSAFVEAVNGKCVLANEVAVTAEAA